MSLCPKSSKSGADFPKKGNPIINRLRVRKLSVDLCNSSIIMCFYWDAIELLSCFETIPDLVYGSFFTASCRFSYLDSRVRPALDSEFL